MGMEFQLVQAPHQHAGVESRLLKFLPQLQDKHVLGTDRQHHSGSVHNHQGGLGSIPLHKMENTLLLLSQKNLASLRAAQLQGILNTVADMMSPPPPPPRCPGL